MDQALSCTEPYTGPMSQTQQDAQPRQPARNALESALLKLPPGVVPDSMFPSDKEIDQEHRLEGYPEAQLPEIRKWYHDRCDQLFEEANRDTINVIGLKPSKGDQVYAIAIPESPLSIRLWDGGLTAQGLYCLDFIDTLTREPVNPPRDHRLYSAPRIGAPSKALVSWERSFHIPDEKIEHGAERFSIFNGIGCCLKRPQLDDFWFDVPEIPRLVNGPQMTLTTA